MRRQPERGDPCSCREHQCANFTAQKGWVKCRPCALGNHEGACGIFKQSALVDDTTCRECGYGRDAH